MNRNRRTLDNLALAPDLFNLARSGHKGITIRNGYRDIGLGDAYLWNAENKEKIMEISVFLVLHCALAYVPADMIKADGFKNHEDAVCQMRKFYPELDAYSEVTVIKWD